MLASRSPQRRGLLSALGIPFRVVVSGVAEGPDAAANAREKARAVAARSGIPPGGAVVAADTEVLLDGVALGKPADAEAAARMLDALSGRVHTVETALVVVGQGGERATRAAARVRIRPLTPRLVDWYVASGEWRERAGGYAVQGRGGALVEEIEGDPSTVIGLPLGPLLGELAALGIGPWAAPQNSGG